MPKVIYSNGNLSITHLGIALDFVGIPENMATLVTNDLVSTFDLDKMKSIAGNLYHEYTTTNNHAIILDVHVLGNIPDCVAVICCEVNRVISGERRYY